VIGSQVNATKKGDLNSHGARPVYYNNLGFRPVGCQHRTLSLSHVVRRERGVSEKAALRESRMKRGSRDMKSGIRLPGKGIQPSMAQGRSTTTISMIKWIQTSRLQRTLSLSHVVRW
jgi:hypothetical protein